MRDEDHLLAINSARWRKLNRPPLSDENPDLKWAWLTVEIMMSDSFKVLTVPAFKILLRIMAEHAAHGGGENGNLVCTYESFIAAGIRRSSIKKAIALLVKVGLVDIEVKGRGGKAGAARWAARYRLTWLPMRDGAPATNRWKRFEAVRRAQAGGAGFLHGNRAGLTPSIYSSHGSGTDKKARNPAFRKRNSTGSVTGESTATVTAQNEFSEAVDAA